MKTVKSIVILGAGTAGYVTALILKQKFGVNINIKVIHSSKIGIIGVGEGSTEHWADFLKFVEIDHAEVIKECDATIKCGILFKGWGDQDYLHNVATPYDQSWGQTRIGYMKLIAEGAKPFDMVQQEMLENKDEFVVMVKRLNRDVSLAHHEGFHSFKKSIDTNPEALDVFLNFPFIMVGLLHIEELMKGESASDLTGKYNYAVPSLRIISKWADSFSRVLKNTKELG